nr:hypothetical protein [Tanacetum cinerariifolium]
MCTRRSVCTSPLDYDPVVERSARLRRKAVRQFSTNLDFVGLKEIFTKISDDEATGAESPPRGNFENPSPIVYPAVDNGAVSNFKIQPNLIAILPVSRDTYQVNNTTKDGVRLRPFPFSLKDQAKAWFTSLEPGSIHSCELSKKVDVLLRNLGKGVPNVSQVSHNACSMCNDPSHSVNNCQSWGAPSNEEVNGVYGNRPRNDPFSESYNLGWRNHPNFRWKDDDNYNPPNNTQQQNHGYIPRYKGGDSSNFQQNYQQQSSYQQRPQQNKNQGQGSSNGQQSNIDQKFNLILSELAKSNQGANLKFESLSKSVVNLERKMGQLAKEVHKREAGKLPSYPDLNPKHKLGGPEHVNMDFVTDDEIIVEGKKVNNVKSDSELVNDLLKYFPKPRTQNSEATESPKDEEGGMSSTTTSYPAALKKSASARLAKKGPYSEDMWEIFKQVKINLTLIDAIKKIPAYAKFLKDFCTQKRKLKATLPKQIDLTKHVSAVLSSSLPPKFKDPEAPLISVVVGNIAI